MPLTSLPLSGDPAADELLASDPLALLIGMVLDQQIPLERAFHSPLELSQRLGRPLEAAEIADMDPERLVELFSRRPTLHRFPGSMARRVQDVCRVVADQYAGQADQVWESAPTGEALLAGVRALPGFGEHKARIFVALLAKRMGVAPPGWEEAAGDFGEPGSHLSVADIDSPEALAQVRAHKAAVKAAARAQGADVGAKDRPGSGGRDGGGPGSGGRGGGAGAQAPDPASSA